MFVCLFVWLFLFSYYLSHLRIPQGRFPESFFLNIGLDLADILWIKKCLIVCLFFLFCFLFESSRDNPGKVSWKFCKNQTWYSWFIVNLKELFICLFVFLFVFLFCFLFESSQDSPRKIFWNFCKDQTWFGCVFNHLGITFGRYPESLRMIGLDLVEILSF